MRGHLQPEANPSLRISRINVEGKRGFVFDVTAILDSGLSFQIATLTNSHLIRAHPRKSVA
ncbi:MAG: hypothetical protein DMG93_07420 [Acidobacteria bacterium]|nr:MAG: hypothetical protein DMG93_07420 [Acidobacteriota bacterium]